MSDPRVEVARISNDPAAIAALRNRLVKILDQAGFSEASTFAVRLAFEEALSNAFRHGHRGLPGDEPVEVRLQIDHERAEIVVEDQGPGFDPSTIPDPTLSPNLEKPSGRGLMLIRAYMTRVEHNERGNRVRMVFECSQGSA